MSEHDVRSLRYGRKRIHENSVLNISQISSTSSDSTQPVTRGLRSKHWLVGYPIEILTGAKLPTNLLVLRRYLSLRFDSALCKKKRDIAEEVLSELLNTFWLPSRIPTREKKHCIDIILKLATAYENLKKTPVARRETNACSKKIQIFLASLHSLCDLSPTNCYDILRQSGYDEWETDWNFLVGQRLTPQVGSMEGVDKILAAKEKKKMEREKLQENRLMNERIRLSKAEIEAEVIISEQSEIEDEENLDSDSSFEMIEKKKKQQTCSLQLPVKTLISESAAVAERFRISDRQLFAVTSSTIKLGGGKISDFSLSVSTTNRHQIDKDVAETNLHSLNRHLDYLTEELVVFALFNSQTPSEEKNMMGKKLSMTPRPSVFVKGKPSPPTITVTAAKHNSLSHFIGPRSWLLFHLLKLKDKQQWLSVPSEFWPNFDDFNTAHNFVNNLQCINDSAERGIKLIGDFNSRSKDPEEREFLAQVVENHRKQFPGTSYNSNVIQSSL